MLDSVLFPIIFNDFTKQIVECLGNLKQSGVKKVFLLHIYNEVDDLSKNFTIEDVKEKILEWKNYLESFGFDVDYEVKKGNPWEEIVNKSENNPFSFIIMGSHGSSLLDKMFLGSVTETVVHHVSKPVLIYKYQKDNKCSGYCENIFSKILFANDFSNYAEKCISYIENMKINNYQELYLLHVQDLRNLKYVSKEKLEEFNKIDKERLEKLKNYFMTKGFNNVFYDIKVGYSISEILNYSKEKNTTLLVIGKKGKSDISEMIMGGAAETLIHKINTPVFLV